MNSLSRIVVLAAILLAAGLTGCTSSGRTHITSLSLPSGNRAALKLDTGSPRVTVNNRGPGSVAVRFESDGGRSNGARIRRGGKVTREIDTPGRVVVETDDLGADVTFVIERMSGFEIEPATPK